MDLTAITTAIGLATTALGATEKAAATAEAVKKLFSSEKKPDSGEVQTLLNTLAGQLTAANMMNVQLSEAIRTLSIDLKREDEFAKEKARYELCKTPTNDIVFKLREDASNGQPPHFVCPVCLNRDKVFSYLAPQGDFMNCQTIREHMFQFSSTDWNTSVDDDYDPLS